MHFGDAREVAEKSNSRSATSSNLRMTLRRFAFFSSLILGSLLAGSAVADPGDRVALVVSAEEYAVLGKSAIGVKRATDIAAALEAKGFDVVLGSNATNSTARAKLREFSEKVEDADAAVVVMIGHGTAAAGQSFFLPANADIGRPTDLFSRAISVPNVTQIAGRAKAAGVFFFVTTPDFKAPVAGLDARPLFNGEAPGSAVVVFSTSASVPVSSIDGNSALGADAFLAALEGPEARLADLVQAVAGSGKGQVVGTPADLALMKPATPEAPAPVAETTPAEAPPATDPAVAATEPSADPAKLEAERQARAEAEQAAAAERAKAEEAQLAAQRAQADVELAKAEAAKAQAEAERAQAEARKAQAEAERAKAEAEKQLATATPATTASISPLVPETELGRQERRRIQEKLRDLSLYTGPIDSVMGPLTREAIMGFQRSRNAAVTGYLTADQYDALLATGQ